jgi:predicted AAA+ superfamily ATPase
LVTGSARLDLYRFGGDSLQGRYHLHHLHPLSAAELSMTKPADLQQLLELGGFPEPFFAGSKTRARRWSQEHRTLLVREEVASLEQVQDLGRIELLMLRLPEVVASPLSINALREDLEVSHRTVDRWLKVLERLWAIFRIAPYGPPRVRAVRKMNKHYHLDWTVVPDPGPRFENLVACHLLKWVDHERDAQGRNLELRYYRDQDGREVDFVVLEGKKPVLLVEAKAGDADVDRGLRYLKSRFPECAAWQIAATGRKDYQTPEGIRVGPALALLATLV